MSMLMKFSLLAAVLTLTVGGCAKHKEINTSGFCDHPKEKPATVEVAIVGEREKLKADPPIIIACNGDDIDFKAVNLKGEFEILFKQDDSPFKKNLKSSKGSVKEKVVINPTRRQGPVFIKYDVKVPGYELLDPKIIITPR